MQSNGHWRRLLLLCLFKGALLFILAVNTFAPGGTNLAVAQSNEVSSLREQYVERVLQTTFSTMPTATEPGSATIPDLGAISWSAGQTPDEFLRLGIFYDSFNLQLLSLDQIAQLSGVDYSGITLADIGLLQDKTITDLVSAIPDLGQWQIFQVPLLEDLLGGFLNNDPAPWEELPLQQLISQYSLGDVGLSNIDLSQYGLDAIPGLLKTPLGRLPEWEKTFISEIPGLKDVPFAAFPGIPTGRGYVALFDVAYGKAEARRLNTITGSDVEGFEVPCNEDSCPYIELSGPPWLDAEALHGKQWLVGGEGGQMVRGGHGPLAAVNGGMEPTGRHPYGPGFKVVLLETNESEGSGKFGLYFRYCTTLGGCTPYFIGPIPWLTNYEDDIIFVGLNYSAQPPPDVPSHPGLPPGTELPPSVEPLPEPVLPGEPNQNCDAECPQKGACSGRFINPAPNYPVTDEFGYSPWRGRDHDGIDIGTPTGTPIMAADGGQIIFAGEYRGYGLTVDIAHCNGYVSRYAHLSGISVTNGQAVSQGQVVAQSGATGAGTGPHLHFEIRTGQPEFLTSR